MVIQSVSNALGRLRERWSDPLLTALTALLILMLFVFAPLQAVGIKMFQELGFASALGLIGGAFFMSGSPVVARAVFAPGRVSYHRIIGAVLVYLSVAVTFAALFTIVGMLFPQAFFWNGARR
jgi:hypothetical protein